MSVFEISGHKGPGVITRLAIMMPKSALLWRWSLLLLTIFCPLVAIYGLPYQMIISFSYFVTYYSPGDFYGWFIVFPIGDVYIGYGAAGLLVLALYIPVLLALRSFDGIVKKRKPSRIARFFHWYYFLAVGIISVPFMFYQNYIVYPIGFIPWFLMYLRYKQLNYYLEIEEPKTDTGVTVVTVPTTSTTATPAATTESPVRVVSGYDVAGENLKLAVKVSNEGTLAIMNVTVNLDAPDGFEYVSGTLPSQKIGNISAGSYQSAIFWLKPERCVDDEYGGSVIYRDAQNKSHTVIIPRKRIVNVCPMLEETDDVEAVFKKLKFGSLARNCASFKFTGSAKTVYELAKARLRGLDPVDRSEQTLNDGNFLGYACFVGQTKFGDQHFAAEVQTTGTESSGVLTLSVYSDDERILSGYMVDVMQDVREHVEVIEEAACPLATCPKCGADIDPSKIDETRVYICTYCGSASKVAPWLV